MCWLNSKTKEYDYQTIIRFLGKQKRENQRSDQSLGEQGINMHAFSMAETTDFGILRLIVSDVDKAVEVLRAKDFAVILTDVVCISCPNVAGALSKILEKLAEHQIFIEYMYAFAQGDRANIVIRPSNLSECLKQLSEEDCHILGDQQL